MSTIQFKPLSEQAMFVQFSSTINEQTQQQIQLAVQLLQQHPFPGLLEIVPSYTNFCVYYDPLLVQKSLPHAATISQRVQNHIQTLLAQQLSAQDLSRRVIEIPVVYGGEYGPDLLEVAHFHHLSPEEVIAIHTARDYIVYMLGFAPGFPYLGGLDARIATPRRATPRLEIAAGSVGIGGEQTGIYPFNTPGGWQIIGRTMTPLFSLTSTPPALLQAGDIVRFIAVEEDEVCCTY